MCLLIRVPDAFCQDLGTVVEACGDLARVLEQVRATHSSNPHVNPCRHRVCFSASHVPRQSGALWVPALFLLQKLAHFSLFSMCLCSLSYCYANKLLLCKLALEPAACIMLSMMMGRSLLLSAASCQLHALSFALGVRVSQSMHA